ncbi:MAG: hypothetical protein RR316_03150, partial [Clostridia bacterium]
MEYYEEVVKRVKEEYEKRREGRLAYELMWQMNMNFLSGNQYCTISPRGIIENVGTQYEWQLKEVYNHIAPIMETRMSKLLRVRPCLTVSPFSDSESDTAAAKVSELLLNSILDNQNMQKVLADGCSFSETCGTVFYKVVWNTRAGKTIGRYKGSEVYEGDIDITLCPPFEIYPDSNTAADVNDCNSIIHARALPVTQIKAIWGKEVLPEEICAFSPSNNSNGGYAYNYTVPSIAKQKLTNCATVIEFYEKATADLPKGRLTIVAGDKALYIGDLPYTNQSGSQRGFPFIRQTSLQSPGCFWGVSIIERLIPLQRSYNAVKNRKYEYLNRLAAGILAVEEGSVNTDELEQEGLYPGKILVYRQGSELPKLLAPEKIPADFKEEEERLLAEFAVISGVSDLMRSSNTPVNVTSGIALNLLMEQDDSRMLSTSEQVRNSLKIIGLHILRIYKQFAELPRLFSITDNEGRKIVKTFDASEL